MIGLSATGATISSLPEISFRSDDKCGSFGSFSAGECHMKREPWEGEDLAG
jgi:hypothetical protein